MTTHNKKNDTAENKKTAIDKMKLEIRFAENELEELKTVVNALTQKEINFANLLSLADGVRSQTLANKNTVDQLINSVRDLKDNSATAFDESVLAKTNAIELADFMKELLDKLVYSFQRINVLSDLIIKRKALNPLISDELVAIITQAGSNANNAVALTLIALKSVCASLSSNVEAESIAALATTQSLTLFNRLTGAEDQVNLISEQNNSIIAMIHNAYTNAKNEYEHMQNAWQLSVNELNVASLKLSKAEINLKSLQSGLTAANAAVVAS